MNGRILGADPSLPRRNLVCQSPQAGHEGVAKPLPHQLLLPIPPDHLHGLHPTLALAHPGPGPDPHPTAPIPAALPDTARSQEADPGPGPSPRPHPRLPHLPHTDLQSEPRGSRPRLPGKQGRSQSRSQPHLQPHRRPPKLLLLHLSLPNQEIFEKPGGRSGKRGLLQGGGHSAAVAAAAAAATVAPVPDPGL